MCACVFEGRGNADRVVLVLCFVDYFRSKTKCEGIPGHKYVLKSNLLHFPEPVKAEHDVYSCYRHIFAY